jgi:hypothetical protein
MMRILSFLAWEEALPRRLVGCKIPYLAAFFLFVPRARPAFVLLRRFF